MLAWFVARHVLYLAVCYSAWAHVPSTMPYACFSGPHADLAGPMPHPADGGLAYLLEPLLRQDGLVCFNHTVQWAFISALLFLQAITLFWFAMIIRVAVGVFRGEGADDSRSDVEDEGEADGEEAEEDVGERPPLEEEVGVEGLDLKGWERRAGVKRAVASGVSLPGHSDRKELLGRIGCEKQVD